DRRDYFDVYAPSTLETVKVFANTAGSRTIEMWNAAGTLVHTLTVNIPAGTSRVTLNFSLPVGTSFYLKCSGTLVDLYRNSAGATFPYTIPGILSITGTDAVSQGGTIYYYYFF